MVSRRVQSIDASGIRKVFDLAKDLKDPIDLSIGQPDFDAFDAVKESIKRAIDAGKSGYTVTQGISELREKIKDRYSLDPAEKAQLDVFTTAGVSAGLVLSYLTLLDPGDQILIPDPHFVIYRDLAVVLGIEPVCYDTYPDFALVPEKIEAAITPKTKAIMVNSPSNPTGYACNQRELDQVVEVARRHDLYVIYDEIYNCFCFDKPHPQCLGKYGKVILLNGFSKSAGVPGWRIGYVIAPADISAQMLKVQQYSFVCANSVAQWAMLDAMDVDFSGKAEEYKQKRDFMVQALQDKFNLVPAGGAFYLFPEAPGGSGQKFVEQCIKNNLLVIPGSVFSARDTHFRLSFSAPMERLERGAEVLNRLA